MKQSLIRLYLPITLLLFGTITKWWFGLAIDGKDVYFYGFPIIYKGEGFHTSLSTQFFLIALLIDFLFYFLLIVTLGQLISRIWIIRISKNAAKLFWGSFGVFILVKMYFSIFIFDDRYLLTRHFKIETFDTGMSLFGQHSKDRSIYREHIAN